MAEQGEDMFNPQSFDKQSDSPYKKPRNRKNSPNGTWGKWTQQESLKYVMFMESHQDIFNSREKRRISRIFKEMAKYIPTRTAIQCRSHHQKLVTKFRNFKKIIMSFKSEIGQEIYTKKFQQFTKDQKPMEEFSSFNLEKSGESQEEPQTKTVETQTDAVIIIDAQQQKQILENNLGLNPILVAMLTYMNPFPSQ